jgi:DNA-binding NarL/FixJ family response regulator
MVVIIGKIIRSKGFLSMGKIIGTEELVLTSKDRASLNILVVEDDSNDRNLMRSCIKQLGLGSYSDAPNHLAALEKLNERHFSHIIFTAKETNMPVKSFVKQVLEANSEMIMVPSSNSPDVDDVFDLLILGAKGYLVKPFTMDTVEDALTHATKGEPLSDVVLQAKDRNEALVAILMHSLDKTATTMRQARQFETAKKELPRCQRTFNRSSELASTFCKGGSEGLIDAIEKFCLERSKGPATRLGRLRKRLKNTRAD